MLSRIRNVAQGLVHRAAMAHLRSPKWRAVEKAHLKAQPECQACGGRLLRQVHHLVPFEHDPSRELDSTNLETLCMWKGCHLLLGHGDSFRFYVPSVRELCRSVRAGQLTLSEAAVIAKRQRVPIRTSVP